MRPRRYRRLLTFGAVVVLLGAVLPNVLWLGHWNIPGIQVPSQATTADEHASHCHGNASCADGAANGLLWWSDEQDALVLDAELQLKIAPAPARTASDPAIPPLDPPPRYA